VSQGAAIVVNVMEAPSVKFAEAVRSLGDEARRLGLLVPGFRSPPRVIGFGRTLRRRSDGTFVVAVAIKNRPWVAVLADMVEGIVIANGLNGADAASARDDLWAVTEHDIHLAA